MNVSFTATNLGPVRTWGRDTEPWTPETVRGLFRALPQSRVALDEVYYEDVVDFGKFAAERLGLGGQEQELADALLLWMTDPPSTPEGVPA